MKRGSITSIIFIVLFLWLAIDFVGNAQAQVSYYSNDWGKDMGTSYTLANTTYFNDAYGNQISSASTLAPAPVYVPIQTVVPVAPNYVPVMPPLPMLAPLSLPGLPMWGAK